MSFTNNSHPRQDCQVHLVGHVGQIDPVSPFVLQVLVFPMDLVDPGREGIGDDHYLSQSSSSCTMCPWEKAVTGKHVKIILAST